MGNTIKDVAMRADVSIATVSRVLAPENSGGVTERTRTRVLNAAEELGYQLNYTARSLKRHSTMMIAVVFPELGNEFFMDVAEGIERELLVEGYTMLISSSFNSIEEEKKRISMLAGRMVDGMVISPAGSQGEHIQSLSDKGMPVVLVDRIVEGTRLDVITSDNEDGAFKLTKALLSDGYRRIGFVGGNIALSTARERFNGYARALGEAEIKPEPSWICLGGMEKEDGYRLMKNLLEKQSMPEAVVAVNQLVHLGMERCLLDWRLFTVKEPTVVIAGFDESYYTPFLPACRYIAAQDAAGLGSRAGKRVIEKIRERKKPDFANVTRDEQIIRLPVTINTVLSRYARM